MRNLISLFIFLFFPTSVFADFSSDYAYFSSSNIMLDSMVSFSNAEKIFLGHVKGKPDFQNPYECSEFDHSRLEEKLTVLRDLLQNKLIIKNYNLKLIVICGKIAYNNRSIGGVAFTAKQVMFIDGSLNIEKFTHLFWHELWHFIEYTLEPDIILNWSLQYNNYLNKYPKKKVSIRLGSAQAGFINEYGQTFPYEERAEIFSFLKMSPSQLKLFLDTKKDGVLKSKINFIKDMLESLESR